MKSEVQKGNEQMQLTREREVVTDVLNRKPVQLPSNVNCQFNTNLKFITFKINIY